jgi:hypothetical protein
MPLGASVVSGFAESVVEDAALAWPEGLGWRVARGPDIAPETPVAERARYGEVLGDETLRLIARELVRTVRANVKTDWTMRENVRAQLRVLVKRILRKYGYPPDKQERATQTVLEQAEVLSQEWAVA